MMAAPPLIVVIDDDESVRESLPDLLRAFGFAALAFTSGEAFLASACLGQAACLILDIAMPGMSGPDLQWELTRRNQRVPIIFVTGDSNAADRMRLLRLGGSDCLSKPFSDTALFSAIEAALLAG